MDTSAYLLSSGAEYSTSDTRCPVENLEQCDEGQNGCNERDNLCRAVSIEFQPLMHGTCRMIGHTGITVKKITPLVAED